MNVYGISNYQYIPLHAHRSAFGIIFDKRRHRSKERSEIFILQDSEATTINSLLVFLIV
jgi:hypothetical protein